jgi:UDP-N-acetylglucosamine diphosphorylase/glucosamine-1-phosphate N-acetyltransferase
MDKIIFTEEFCQPENMFPFTLTRQLQDMRVGILTIREKWERALNQSSFDKKENDYKDLSRSVHLDEAVGDGSCLLVHGNLLPTVKLLRAVRRLNPGEFIAGKQGNALVYLITRNEIINRHKIKVGKQVTLKEDPPVIQYPWDCIRLNDWAIREDFKRITKGRKSQKLSKTNTVMSPGNVFVEKEARVEHCMINAQGGPVYIGKGAELMEGCLVRGPFSIGENACLKMGAQVYPATSIGPHCVAGGEIKNSIMQGYSNKAHGGYLGDSVVGAWCNLGAGTTTSNLKNNAGTIRVWTSHGEQEAGLKCGAMIGDYSRTVINSSINSGTVIGVCAHVQGPGLTPRYVPNFSWGSEGVARYDFDKAVRDIAAWKKLKNCEMDEEEISVLRYIFEKF